jgi:hypothetical protein
LYRFFVVFSEIATISLSFCFCTPAYALVATGPNGSNAQAVHALGITGRGVNVGLISVGNTRITHEAFHDKDANGLPIGPSHAFAYNATGDSGGNQYFDIYGHDTWVAGIVASRGGVANPTDIGVAPDVNIYNERVVTNTGSITYAFLETALDNLVAHNCHVVYTSFQLPSTYTPNGLSQWTLIYDYYADTHNIVVANAAGNYDASINPTNKVTVFGDAYNGITTGGLVGDVTNGWRLVGYESNLGPTADGRRKPDLVAPSQNQAIPGKASDTQWQIWTNPGGATSFAAPHTAGVAALLLQYADSTTDTDDNENEVIRAVIVNSTFPNIKDNNGVSTTGQLYNVARGYGRIDALRAYETLKAGKIQINNNPPSDANKGWAYDQVQNNTDTYYVAGTQNQRLLVTLTWNRIFYSKYNPKPLVNLTLTVRDPNGIYTRFTETSTKDNLIKCDIPLPYTGNYQIRVSPTGQGLLQDYGLAFEIVPQIPGDIAEPLDYIVDTNDLLTFASQWLLDGTGLTADLASPTGHVDFSDFAVFAQNWLTTNNAYYTGY